MPHYRDDRMQMLMQLLPVILAQQEHQQQNALGYAQLAQTGKFHEGEIAHQRALDALGLSQLQQQNNWHQGELANSQAQLAELAKYHQGELAHQAALVQGQNSADTNRLNMDVVSHLMNNPSVSLDKVLPLLGTIAPQLKPLAGAWHDGAVSAAIQTQTPAVTGMYDLYNKGHDYDQLQKGLQAIRPTMAPEVFAGLPWDQLNQGMQTPPSAPGIDLSILSPEDQARYGTQMQQNQSDEELRQKNAAAYALKQKQAATIHALNVIQQQKANPYYGFAPVVQ